MRSYVWSLVVLSILGFASTIPDENDVVKAIFKQRLQPQIPPSVLEEFQRENIPATIKIVRPEQIEAIPITEVGAVDPNRVTDALISNIDSVIKRSGIDPYTVTDFDFLCFSVSLTIGNFDTLHRKGDADMTIYDPQNYEFNSGVQVRKLSGKFAFGFKFFGIEYDAGVDVEVSTVNANVDFTVSVNPEGGAAVYVKSLDHVDIGIISVDVHGLGPFDGFANIIADIFVNLFKCLIPLFFNGIFLNIINQIAQQLFPPW